MILKSIRNIARPITFYQSFKRNNVFGCISFSLISILLNVTIFIVIFYYKSSKQKLAVNTVIFFTFLENTAFFRTKEIF